VVSLGHCFSLWNFSLWNIDANCIRLKAAMRFATKIPKVGKIFELTMSENR
jgi:hypothetical protein